MKIKRYVQDKFLVRRYHIIDAAVYAVLVGVLSHFYFNFLYVLLAATAITFIFEAYMYISEKWLNK